MALKNTRSQTKILESATIALQNVESNPIIKPLMEALGYNTAKIDQGKALLNTAKTEFDTHQSLEDVRANAYKVFEDERKKIEVNYAKDRKKAKVIFRDNTLALKELGLTGTIPGSYIKWLEKTKLFYQTLHTQSDLLNQLAVVKITAQEVTDAIAASNQLESKRAKYIQAKGNAQNATKTKGKAFKALDKWMSDFYAIARIALEEEPQLLESLGKIVKS